MGIVFPKLFEDKQDHGMLGILQNAGYTKEKPIATVSKPDSVSYYRTSINH